MSQNTIQSQENLSILILILFKVILKLEYIVNNRTDSDLKLIVFPSPTSIRVPNATIIWYQRSWYVSPTIFHLHLELENHSSLHPWIHLIPDETPRKYQENYPRCAHWNLIRDWGAQRKVLGTMSRLVDEWWSGWGRSGFSWFLWCVSWESSGEGDTDGWKVGKDKTRETYRSRAALSTLPLSNLPLLFSGPKNLSSQLEVW